MESSTNLIVPLRRGITMRVRPEPRLIRRANRRFGSYGVGQHISLQSTLFLSEFEETTAFLSRVAAELQ